MATRTDCRLAAHSLARFNVSQHTAQSQSVHGCDGFLAAQYSTYIGASCCNCAVQDRYQSSLPVDTNN
jgi:hypothetical protein